MRIDPATQASMKSFDPFRLDVTNQCLWRGDTRVPLIPKPFAVLRYLVEHPGRLVTRDQLLGAIWPDTYVQPEVLRRYILEIRRALGDRAEAPKYVRTLPKRGYQFMAPVIEDSAAPLPENVSGAANRLVGRSAALADLDRCLTRALDGRRQVVFVVGEPGIGKTSLVDAFQHASAAISGVAVVRGQSVEGFGGKEAYYPLLEAIGQLARGQLRSLVVETLATYAPTWLIQLPSLVGPEQRDALQGELLGASRERMVREPDDHAAANPEHTLINAVLIPMVRAGIEIGRGSPLRAIDHLEAVAPHELGFIAALAPIHLRGQSYLMLGMARQAAEQFQRILDHRGTDPFSPFHAVAPLGLARAWAAAGDVDESLKAYERFLTTWTDADRDVPVLLEARDEYDRLLRAAASNTFVG